MDLGDMGRRSASASAAGRWRVLPVTRAPRRFDVFGLTWERGRAVDAQVRTRRRGGRWSPWTPLHAAGDHGPDRGRPVPGSEPVWTGAADLFQLRVAGRSPGRLRARFVRAMPAARAAGRVSARASRRRRQASGSQTGVPPVIITRAEWGGDNYPPKADPEYGEVLGAFVHHTVTANDYAPEDSAGIVLGILKYHRDHNGWNDIGYNFLVDRYGQVFEGRAGGIDQAVVGAQAQGYNTFTTGIAVMGDHSSTPATPETTEALARLIAWKLPLHAAPVTGQYTVTSRGGSENRYAAGTAVTLERISGHRDGDRTSCPGGGIYEQLPALRTRAAALAVPVSGLTMRADRTRVRHPGVVELAGTLRFSDGASPASKPVQIQFQASGAAWELLETVPTASDGSWRATLTPASTGTVRAVFPGDGTHGALEAPSVRLRVLRRVTIELSTRRSPAGAPVDVEGTVGPTWPSRVELRLERRSGGRWRRVQRKRINVRGGRYSSYVRPRDRGLYRVTVKTPGTTVRRRLRVVGGTGGAAAR